MTRNFTVRLDSEIIRKAKALAAKKETSVSGLVAMKIREAVEQDEAYKRATRRALARLQRHFHLGDIRPLSPK